MSFEIITGNLHMLHLSIFSKPAEMNFSVLRGFGGDPCFHEESVGIIQWLMCSEEVAS